MLSLRFLPGVPLIESPFFPNDVSTIPAEYQQTAKELYENGLAILVFPEPKFDDKVEQIRVELTNRLGWSDVTRLSHGIRVQDAWKFNESVRYIANNKWIIDFLSCAYGRKAFPFQTLNFPVGTQQGAHSDYIHFNSIPDRFMCGVWVAFEDVDEDNGPLFYYPGSHRWPTYQNEHLGISHKHNGESSERKFMALNEALLKQAGIQPKTTLLKKGQAVIWASNLVHGGSPQKDTRRSRWSQVTHYFFEGCGYTTPMYNDVYQGVIEYRDIVNVSNSSRVANVISGENLRFFFPKKRKIFRKIRSAFKRILTAW
jgi:hypothetical protein